MSRKRNIVGNTYGDFVVVEMLYGYRYDKRGYPRTYCKCIGTDDNEYIIRMDALTSGSTKYIQGAEHKVEKIDITNKKFGKLTVLYETKLRSSNGCVIWHCRCDCGNECNVVSTNLISGHTRSCGCRHKSKWEEFIHNYLLSINIEHIEQYRFKDCVNQQKTDMLVFDFYIPELNSIIEYDGEHHFKPIEGWGGDKKFQVTLQNDKIKNQYCHDNNIKLLRLPYTLNEEEIINQINQFLYS